MICNAEEASAIFWHEALHKGTWVPFNLNRESLIEWRQLELYHMAYFPHHILFIVFKSLKIIWHGFYLLISQYEKLCLNLTSLLFQNEQTREILIWCSTFILYVDYVQSPILPYRDVWTLNEVRLSLLQADRYNKQVLDLLNFFLFRFKFVAHSKIKYLHSSRKSPGRLVRLTGFVEVIRLLKPTKTSAF